MVDVGARFRGARTFVEDISGAVPSFYRDAGQELTNWRPKPPVIKAEIPIVVAKSSEQAAPTIFSRIFSNEK